MKDVIQVFPFIQGQLARDRLTGADEADVIPSFIIFDCVSAARSGWRERPPFQDRGVAVSGRLPGRQSGCRKGGKRTQG